MLCMQLYEVKLASFHLNACRTPFAFKTVTREAQAFKYHFSDLQSGIQSPLALASKLYSIGIITEAVHDQTMLPCYTVQEKNRILLTGVKQAIFSNPRCFRKFVQILDDEPTTEPLRKKLLETYCELYIQCTCVHVTCVHTCAWQLYLGLVCIA